MSSPAPNKILIATFGSLGDLHPFIALGRALKAEGYAPVIATSGAYRDYIQGEGLGFAPIRPDADDLTSRLGMDMGEIAQQMANEDRFLFETLIFPYLRESFDDLLAASEGAAAVVAHSLAFSARLLAEVKGLPLITILLSPLMLYSAYDPPLGSRAPVRRAPAFGPAVAYNRFVLWSLSHAIALWAQPLRRLRSELGLQRRYGLELLLGSKSSLATIGLFSPTLAPPQPDHSAKLLVAGHSFHDRYHQASALEPALDAFLAAGEAPIVVTLGSFVARARRSFYADCITAASALGRRIVLLTHDDDTEAMRAAQSDGVYVAGYAPHSLIFPRAYAVVHHGGVGGTGQALRAGRPQLVTPFLGDQFDNAERLQRLGVARTVKGEEATAERLARELSTLIGDDLFARRAETLAGIVAAEDGAAVAARRIAEVLRTAQREGRDA